MTSDPIPTLAEDLAWLRNFEARNGRKLRVLHVGNIANNAYLNAKFLRSIGIDAHVLSYDYYHVMASPEWEDVELLHGHGDDFQPRFSARDLRGYRRPPWFVNAPLISSSSRIAALFGEGLSWRQRLIALAVRQFLRTFAKIHKVRGARAIQLLLMDPKAFVYRLSNIFEARLRAQELVAESHLPVCGLAPALDVAK